MEKDFDFEIKSLNDISKHVNTFRKHGHAVDIHWLIDFKVDFIGRQKLGQRMFYKSGYFFWEAVLFKKSWGFLDEPSKEPFRIIPLGVKTISPPIIIATEFNNSNGRMGIIDMRTGIITYKENENI